MASTRKSIPPIGLLRRSSRTCKIKKPESNLFDVKLESAHVGRSKTTPDVKDSCNNSPSLSPKVALNAISDLAADGYIDVSTDELDLERTLLGGQSFRWTKTASETGQMPAIFTGVVGHHALQLWRCDQDRVAFKKLNIEGYQEETQLRATLEDYFQLKYKLLELYDQWSARDENLKKCCEQYKGFRILRQDPVENVFSFICATCNNIKRISQMIDKMCTKFGDVLKTKQASTNHHSFRTFPQIERLIEDDVFQSLRYELGFGYRAKFITETAKQIIDQAKANNHMTPRDYLLSLRQLPYKQTCKQLQQFPGIGRKVADCICLMSMDHLSAIPVDCHIYEIFCRNYMPKLRQERKSVTDAVHDLIGSYFSDLHGPLAGWSTSVLFIGELKHLKAPKTVDELLSENWSKKAKANKGVKRKKERLK